MRRMRTAATTAPTTWPQLGTIIMLLWRGRRRSLRGRPQTTASPPETITMILRKRSGPGRITWVVQKVPRITCRITTTHPPPQRRLPHRRPPPITILSIIITLSRWWSRASRRPLADAPNHTIITTTISTTKERSTRAPPPHPRRPRRTPRQAKPIQDNQGHQIMLQVCGQILLCKKFLHKKKQFPTWNPPQLPFCVQITILCTHHFRLAKHSLHYFTVGGGHYTLVDFNATHEPP